jgi:uncharacterized membrane protein
MTRASKSLTKILLLIFGMASSTHSSASAIGIAPLSILPGSTASYVTAMNGPGTVVVGMCMVGGTRQSFRWTAGEGMTNIGAHPDWQDTTAYSVSDDGSVIVGACSANGSSRAFRWTISGGVGLLPTGNAAYGVSGNGELSVGQGQSAMKWSGTNPGETFGAAFYSARGISRSGNVTIGTYVFDSFLGDAGAWWPTNGVAVQAFGPLPSLPNAVSGDGAVIVGGGGTNPFRWTASDGAISLGILDSAGWTSPSAVSDDGSIVVGSSGSVACIWQVGRAPEPLDSFLASNGVNLTGWTALSSADGVSSDGATIAGIGVYNGTRQPFIATVPEPSVLSLAVLGGVAMVWRNRSQLRKVSLCSIPTKTQATER